MVLGGISALSLPLGSLVGLKTRLRPAYISAMQAFGAGALIAALSVELVAPTVLALGDEIGARHGDPLTAFYALIFGAVIGGVLYILLDQLVNARGGFLRKTATTMQYFRVIKKRRQLKRLEELSRIPLLKSLSSDHINMLVAAVDPIAWLDGEVIYKEGDTANEVTFILDGRIEGVSGGRAIAEFEPGDVLGLGLVIMGVPVIGTVIARGDVKGFVLSKADFDRLRESSPEFDQASRDQAGEVTDRIRDAVAGEFEADMQWLGHASAALKTSSEVPDAADLRLAREEHRGAPLAIWLGILLDGIPESFVIGAGLLVLLRSAAALDSIAFRHVIPYTLIAGLFLSNFPEALASSVNMRLVGYSKQRIFLLWFSLMIVTALGAGFGYFVVELLNPTWVVFAEGVAAGAMLTMITAAMVPEAVHLGSANAVGLCTLAGFLAAIAFKLLE
jgi:zinc transporter ZupT